MRILTVMIATALLTTTAAAPTNVGEAALDFTLESLEGGLVSLSDFRGQVVMLNFFGYS